MKEVMIGVVDIVKVGIKKGLTEGKEMVLSDQGLLKEGNANYSASITLA